MTSLGRQLVNFRAPEIAIYLRESFNRSGENSIRARSALVLYEQTCFDVTAVILNSIEATGPILNGRVLKMYS